MKESEGKISTEHCDSKKVSNNCQHIGATFRECLKSSIQNKRPQNNNWASNEKNGLPIGKTISAMSQKK